MSWATHHIEKLKRGETVKFRPHGGSMVGRVNSGDLCTVEPLGYPPEVGDVLLCSVGGRHYLHLLTALQGAGKGGSGVRYQISNNHGHVNGWVSLSKIYGKLTKVEK